MATTTQTPNMFLNLPVVGQEPGPQFAIDINSAFTVVDGHNHSPGYGVPISQAGILLTGDLSYSGYSASNILSVILNSQVSAPLTVGTVYENGNDLHWINGAGLDIQITNASGIVGTPGSISGITGTASVNYISPGYFFYSATLTPANIAVASISLANVTASSPTFTLSPPNPLSSSYSWTLPGANPSVSGAQSLLTVSNAGVLSYTVTDNSSLQISGGTLEVAPHGITQGDLALRSIGSSVGAGGVAVSASSENVSFSSTTYSVIANQVVSIITTGRPVQVMLVPDGSGDATFGSDNNVQLIIRIVNNTTSYVLGSALLGVNISTQGNLVMLDTSVAGSPGTYEYVALARTSSANTSVINHVKLIAYEI